MVTLQLNIEPQYADQVELVSNVSLHLGGLGDPHDYPQVLDEIMESKFAFRVRLGGGQASVLQCRDSKELIAKIQEQLYPLQSSCKDIDTIDLIEEQLLSINDSPQIHTFTQTDIVCQFSIPFLIPTFCFNTNRIK
ncbi:hypothetical protein P8452_57848 [Trifolium repens]|nr:hypothetical protein P8452_57848 [Trifolium repens]